MASESPRMAYVYNSQLDAFTIYHISQEDSPRQSTIGPALPALGHATSGAAGTAISKLIVYPLELIITRLQAQKQFQTANKDADYKGVRDAVEKIYHHEGGIRAFYSGVIPETLKGVADSFLFFLAYTYVRQKRLDMRGSTHTLGVLDEIGVGMVAGAFSKLFTTPVQNIVTRKQTAAMVAARNPMSSTSPNLSAKDIALQIRHEKGLQGFWSGYSASLILTLNPSITLLLHKVLLRLLVPRSRRSDPGARITFLLAAISKVMASTVTYPFSLAKTRAQVSSQKPATDVGPTSENEKYTPSLESASVRARQRTVFSTIIRIAKTEGIWGLYQGLGAEVLKGFFSHGITMLMKDRIHVAIINLYYLLLKTMKKYPSPEEYARMASDKAKETYEQGKGHAGDLYAKGAEAVENASESVQNGFANGRQQAGDLLERGKDAMSGAAKQMQNTFVGDEKKKSE
ncbi:mitochondrial carrier domain-containing protein [Clohesyomyces aquaticus]|uniref:Mitochondrial carrier domain-containing protein n=1 Tax=Clohesyomyces aquaticus TaxID=1231657 RepID=A0A1Y2A6I8_9PLEO|nr:mitochondrial carrier domain-containing protein [Clohesyomyces aquaticus]